jgi:hypothetical protein
MTTTTYQPAAARPATFAAPDPALYRWAGAMLLAQFAIFMVAFLTLGSAIDWPASLDKPAGEVLPLIRDQRAAVALGYTSYFISAMLLIPIALLLRQIMRGAGDAPGGGLGGVAAGFGAIAGFAKLLGIGRWLFMMPALADSYAVAGPSARQSLELIYAAFNNYAGGVGENLGVALFGGLWTAGVAVAILRSGILPRWLGYFGAAAALTVLAPLAEVYGVGVGPMLIVSGIIWQLWMIALGGTLLARARRGALAGGR